MYSYLFYTAIFLLRNSSFQIIFKEKYDMSLSKASFQVEWKKTGAYNARHMCIKSLTVFTAFYLKFFFGTVIKITYIVKFDLKYKLRKSNMNIHPLVWNEKKKRFFFSQMQHTKLRTHTCIYYPHQFRFFIPVWSSKYPAMQFFLFQF